MRILVCGGRDYTNADKVWDILDILNKDTKITEIINGNAKGADTLATLWAYKENLPINLYPANWKEEGKKAGYIRNLRMLKEGKPDLVIAFPGGKGTANMVKIAKEANIEVREIK